MFIFKYFIIVSFLILCENVESSLRLDPMVETNVGLIRGQSATDGDYDKFLGIPYASVNASNPFGPSNPYPKFTDTFNAYKDSTPCPHVGNQIEPEIIGTIDCLQLNLYVPKSANSENRLAVLVYIYGGSFMRGSGRFNEYGPKYLMRHDVISVFINYRVSAYGFMCLDIPEVPGNQGLKDQLLALRWINSNIEAFGGDVNRITLFGQSAGGRSVDFHLVSKQEKLFKNVIMQSGNSICPPVIGQPDITPPLKLAEHLGFITDDVYDALKFLADKEPSAVINAVSSLNLVFKPCVEKDFDGIEKFVIDYTINLDIPKAKNTSILLGFNSDEKLVDLFKDDDFFRKYNGLSEHLKNYFDFDDNELKVMSNNVHKFYLGDEHFNMEVKEHITNFESDFTYLHPTHRRLQSYLENGAENIYHYVFNYTGGRNIIKVRNNLTVGGANHADDLGYLFDMLYYIPNSTPSPEDQLIIDRMTTMWTNFAKYNDPTPETTERLPVKWKPITDNQLPYLEINTDLKMKSRPFHKRLTYWNLFFKLNKHSQIGYRQTDVRERIDRLINAPHGDNRCHYST